MENRKSDRSERAASLPRQRGFTILGFVVALLAFPGLLGCASPGEPVDRKPPIPRAVTDLAARQFGNDVVLTFTLPTETVNHRRLEQSPAIEIYRDFESSRNGAAQTAARKNPTLLVTIPAAMLDRYTEKNQVRYADSLHPADFTEHPDAIVVYTVRARVSEKRASEVSNVASLRAYPVPEPIGDLKAEVTHTAVVLTWSPPGKDPTGAAPTIASYHIYRGEAESNAAGAVRNANTAPTVAPAANYEAIPADLRLKSPLARIGESNSATFSDAQFDFGKTYVYSIRSEVAAGALMLESADSNLAVVTPRDTFPPAAPEHVVVVFVPPQGGAPAHLELSWAPSPEPDAAGYNVYRSEQEGVPGTRVNTELLLTPAFRDINVVSGHRYSYTIAAVDRSGNESARSEAVSGNVTNEGQQTQ
jgi:hypothetical protein